MNFKEFLNEESKPLIKHIAVFDFDGTIGNVPERPSSWFGKDWWGHEDSLSEPHYDGSVNHEVIEAFRQANKDPNTRAILLTGRRGVIAHGVRNVLRSNGLFGKRIIPDSNKEARNKFNSALSNGKDSIHPEEHKGHEEFYSGDFNTEGDYPRTAKGKPDGTTLAHKFYVIKNLMNRDIESLEFWEDRADHIPSFCKLGIEFLKEYGVDSGGKLASVVLHRVYPPAMKGGQGTVQHIPIKKDMQY